MTAEQNIVSCPNCKTLSYAAVMERPGAVAGAVKDGWVHLVDHAGMAKPCAEHAKKDAGHDPTVHP